MNRLQKEAVYSIGWILLLVLSIILIWHDEFSPFGSVLFASYYLLKPRFLGDPKDKYEYDELETEILSKASDISKTTMLIVTFLGLAVCSYLISDHNKVLGVTFNHITLIFFSIITAGVLTKTVALFISIHYYQKPHKQNKDTNE